MRRGLAAALLLAFAASAGAEEGEPPAWAKALRLRGRLAEEFAYRLHDPGDVSKIKTLGWLEGKYAVSESVAVRAAVRGWYDAVFEATDRYPANVERDQKTDLSLREALLLVGRGDLDVRIGRQQIVWGEAISTFVTDVVNPKDFREFVLPDFTELRIPIWALDASYSLARSEGGMRLSVLREGWDVSLIYYDEADKSPVFFQRRVPRPAPRPDVI